MTGAPLPEFGEVEQAEDFFEALGVSYDRRVVAAHRTQILRLFGKALTALEATAPFLGEEGMRATLRGALRDAHDAVAAGARAPSPARTGQGQVVVLRRRT